MRKFYSFTAGVCLVLAHLQINAQIAVDSCRADFERINSTTNNPLTTGFRALPWISSDKRPEEICWNFGDNYDTCIKYDPTLSNNYFVSHTYAHSGTYNVCVRIKYHGGCVAEKCRVTQIGDADSCAVKFETVNSTANVLAKYFVAQPWNNHNKKPLLICWDFGDQRDTCIEYSTNYTGAYGVYHSYTQVGSYNVCVRVRFDGGCEAHYCRMVQVGELRDSCSADFEVGANSSTPLSRQFVAKPWHNKNKKPVYICWNFGDNRDTCIQYSNTYSGPYGVNHTYHERGRYEVCVRIVYDGGCEAKKCKAIEIGQPDSCKVSFETLSVASNTLAKYFVAKPWHNHNKKPVRICWNFGDNRDTCIEYSPAYNGPYAVFHSYYHPGIYNVCVKIRYDGGCESYYCHTVQVGEPDSCKVTFETLSVNSNKLAKYFIAKPLHNHNKKPVRICWNFGDNRDTCIEYSTSYTGPYAVSHSYYHPGNYNVCVKVRYDGGCESYYCHAVEVGERDSCRADFERIAVSTSNDASRVYYRALPSHNHDKKPARICWIFGDGRDTCISYPENYNGAYTVGHRYEHSGIYEVCVKILYYGGCEAKKCKIVNIFLYNNECRVHLYEIVPSATSLTRGFYFTSTNDRRPARICWDFGDGTDTCINIGPDATEIPHVIRHTYPAPGVYKACVKVLFTNGCTASDCVEVGIRRLTDICGGYYTASLINPHTYLFKGFGIHRPNDAVVSYRWSFGDGSTGTGQQVTHTYNAAGLYRVCLLINTEKGCETRICNDVRVAGPVQSTLQLTPNPVVNILHAVFYSTHNETVKVKIINANGAVVREYTRPAVMGLNTWEFDVTTLVPGVYSLVVLSPNQFASAIFFKQ